MGNFCSSDENRSQSIFTECCSTNDSQGCDPEGTPKRVEADPLAIWDIRGKGATLYSLSQDTGRQDDNTREEASVRDTTRASTEATEITALMVECEELRILSGHMRDGHIPSGLHRVQQLVTNAECVVNRVLRDALRDDADHARFACRDAVIAVQQALHTIASSHTLEYDLHDEKYAHIWVSVETMEETVKDWKRHNQSVQTEAAKAATESPLGKILSAKNPH